MTKRERLHIIRTPTRDDVTPVFDAVAFYPDVIGVDEYVCFAKGEPYWRLWWAWTRFLALELERRHWAPTAVVFENVARQEGRFAMKVAELQLAGTVDALRGEGDAILLITSLIINNEDGVAEKKVAFALPPEIGRRLAIDDRITVQLLIERDPADADPDEGDEEDDDDEQT